MKSNVNEVENKEVVTEPVPIDTDNYTNYLEYLKRRLEETYGTEKFNWYIQQDIIVVALEMLASATNVTDSDMIRHLNGANVELLKDAINIEDVIEIPLDEYYLKLKQHVPNLSKDEAISYAEDMIIGFYRFLFNEVKK